MTPAPRSIPDEPFPPYTFVPGRTPHPVSDPRGHSHGKVPERPPPLDPANWQASRAFLRGIDLFNHGYYWEAHEAWEGLWHACGRKGPVAEFLKGLIHLAAAGVKMLECRGDGVVNHAYRARELFQSVRALTVGEQFLGLCFDELRDACEQLRSSIQGPSASEQSTTPCPRTSSKWQSLLVQLIPRDA